MLQLPCPAYGDLDLEIRTLSANVTESAAWIGVHGTVNIGSVSIADECAAELRSHDGCHATGTTDFELYISMFVPQSSGCFPLCLSLHGTCRALAQMYILVTHMMALQLPFHLTTVGPLAPYKSCVSHPCIARACTDCDLTIWYFVFILFHRSQAYVLRFPYLMTRLSLLSRTFFAAPCSNSSFIRSKGPFEKRLRSVNEHSSLFAPCQESWDALSLVDPE